MKRDIVPVDPLVTEVRIDQLNDRDWRYAWHNAKVRWSIAKQVRDLRLSRGWSQAELAVRAGTYVSVISGIENQKWGFPTINTLIRIAWAFDCAFICRFVGWGEWLKSMEELEHACQIIPSFTDELADKGKSNT